MKKQEWEKEGWVRDLDRATPQQAWAIVMRAWRSRRRYPGHWRLIMHRVNFVGELQVKERDRRRKIRAPKLDPPRSS